MSDGGPNCTPVGFEQSGDADPGWSHDGTTIYSSRGFPKSPPGAPDGGMPAPTVRKLYAFSSDAWYAGKPERDLSLPSEPDCSEGVPKGSPDGTRILLIPDLLRRRHGGEAAASTSRTPPAATAHS